MNTGADWVGNELVLVRDHGGSIPLFFAIDGAGEPHWAHHPLELARTRGKPRVDAPRLADFFCGEDKRTDRSFFDGVAAVRPGERVRVAPGSQVHREWLDVPRNDCASDGGLAKSLSRAVHASLSDSTGVMLSAGMDSSIMALFASGGAAEPTCFGGAPAGPVPDLPKPLLADESRLAAETASELGLPFVRCAADGPGLLERHRRILPALGQPFTNLANLGWIAALLDAARERGCTQLLDASHGNVVISHDGRRALEQAVHDGRAGAAAGHWLDHVRGGHGSGLVRIARAVADRVAGRPSPDRERKEELHAIDNGPFARAYEELFQVRLVDPTADEAVIAASMALSERDFAPSGRDRGLAQTILEGRVPAKVAEGRLRGIQGADWRWQLRQDEKAVRALLAEARPLAAAHGIGIDAMIRFLDDALVERDAESVAQLLDGQRFMRQLAALDFLVWLEEGAA